ncbi:MAG: CPBP family intramembrane metalloprotease [Bacteroidetes bacterium]|nr:CPBP family intramembrane metalloprotease [Bacteroidota bacterium]
MRFFEYIPRLKDRPFIIQLLVLILIIFVSTVLLMVLGIVAALPIYGLDAISSLGMVDYSGNAELIGFLKYFQVVNQLGVFIVPAIVFAYLYNKQPASYLQINRNFSFSFLVLSVVLILITIPFVNRLVEINEQMQLPGFMWRLENWMRNSEDQTRELTDAFLSVSSISGLFVNLLIIALLAALSEELLFRGVILQLFHQSTRNVHLAVIISAILFSGLHMQFYGFLPRTLLGILFGYLFVWSGSLWIPIILHFIFNGISVVAAYLYEIGRIQTDVASLGTNLNNFVVLGSALGSLILMLVLNRKFIQSQKVDASH